MRWQCQQLCQGCVKDQLEKLCTARAEDVFHTSASHRCDMCKHDAHVHFRAGPSYHSLRLEQGYSTIFRPPGMFGYIRVPVPNIHDGGARRCVTCLIDADDNLSTPLRCCGRCKSQLYCGRECQEWDWKKRHKQECNHRPQQEDAKRPSPSVPQSRVDCPQCLGRGLDCRLCMSKADCQAAMRAINTK